MKISDIKFLYFESDTYTFEAFNKKREKVIVCIMYEKVNSYFFEESYEDVPYKLSKKTINGLLKRIEKLKKTNKFINDFFTRRRDKRKKKKDEELPYILILSKFCDTWTYGRRKMGEKKYAELCLDMLNEMQKITKKTLEEL